jgi:xanthine dehydrogenase YagT iron-sulfur-binding subunit
LTKTAPPTVAVELEVNGSRQRLDLDPRATLLDTLREKIGLHGAKKGCDHGQCGACTVHIDGRRVVSCLSLAVQAQGKRITTIEGIAGADGRLHPMQEAPARAWSRWPAPNIPISSRSPISPISPRSG